MAELAFWKPKNAFTEAPIHQHFDPAMPIMLQTGACGFTFAGILNKDDNFVILRPVNSYSQKCSPALKNYNTYDQEVLAIMATWRQH